MTITERVSKGIAWLDQEAPGWRGKVDWNRLNISDEHLCIAGQVFKDEQGFNGYRYLSGLMSVDDRAAHGFTFLADEHYYEPEDLNFEWRRQGAGW